MSVDVIQRRKETLAARIQEAQVHAQEAAQAHAHWQTEVLGCAAALRELEELEREIGGGTDESDGAIDDDQVGAPALRVVRSRKGEDTSKE